MTETKMVTVEIVHVYSMELGGLKTVVTCFSIQGTSSVGKSQKLIQALWTFTLEEVFTVSNQLQWLSNQDSDCKSSISMIHQIEIYDKNYEKLAFYVH